MVDKPVFSLPLTGSPLAPKARKEDLETQVQAGFTTLYNGITALEGIQLSGTAIYDDTAAGLAATSDGDYFSIPSTNEEEGVLLYKNEAGSATLVKSYPSTAALKKIQPEYATFLQRGKNLFNRKEALTGYFVSANGTLTADSNYAASEKMPVEAGATYTVSPGTMRFYAMFDSDGIVVPSEGENGSSNSLSSFTVPASGVAYVQISIPVKDVGRCQVEKGATATTFEAFRFTPKEPLSILSETAIGSGKNLFDATAATDGVFVNGQGNEIENTGFAASDYIAVEPGETYAISPAARFIATFDASQTEQPDYFVDNGGSNITSFTAPDNGVSFIRISFPSPDYLGGQVEKAAAPTTYEPYRTLKLSEDVELDDYQATKGPMFGAERLRHWRMFKGKRWAGESAQIDICLVGDSYTQLRARWSLPFAEKLFSDFGDGGGGWTGYGYYTAYSGPYATGGTQPVGVNGNVRATDYTLSYDGAWQSHHKAGPSPDLDYISSSTAGDKITRTVPAAPDHTALRLVWLNSADGQARYRIDGGSWTTVDMTGTVDTIGSTDIALTAGAHTVEIEVVSGTVKLCGDNALSNADGVRIHKLGSSGSKLIEWASMDETEQVAAFTALEPDTFVIMDGTNSQANDADPLDWSADMVTMFGRFRLSGAQPDILVAIPPENLRGFPVPMRAYADQGRKTAWDQDCAFLDHQSAFGPVPADYASDAAFPLFNSDDTHPQPETGGRVMAASFLSAFL